MEKFRRTDRNARAMLSVAEMALTRAASSLFRGDAITAARSARLVESLLVLDQRISSIETLRADAAADIRAEKRKLREWRDELEAKDRHQQHYETELRRLASFICEISAKENFYAPDEIVWLANSGPGPLPAREHAKDSGVAPK